jgi:peptidoglycan DL-endopeptidase CwlO
MQKVQSTIIVLLFVTGGYFSAKAQIKQFDKLEMWYDQGHYKLVYRKANHLLDIPDYDFSQIPNFYKSISIFQLCQSKKWFKRHPDAILEARELFLQVRSSSDGVKLFKAHQQELIYLKNDLTAWLENLKSGDDLASFHSAKLVIGDLFDKFQNVEVNETTFEKEEVEATESMEVVQKRNDIITFAKKQIGVPYVWAGSTPSGFDCSGFTGYIMKEFGKTIPRRAVDQEKEAKKVKSKNVQKGDLVFFDSGYGISHVGIVVSEKGAPLQMIHASSSKGVIITDVSKSDYWMQRLVSFGTYFR